MEQIATAGGIQGVDVWRVNSNRWITADIVTRWVDGAHINVGSGHDWASISRDDADAWLEIKGAFGGTGGYYQPKNPRERASCLHHRGEA